MISPLAFATMAISGETWQKQKKKWVDTEGTYARWYKSIRDKIFSVLGLSIGLNVFFLLVPLIRDFKLFSDTQAFSNIPFASILSVNAINAIVQLIMLICSVYVIKSAPQLVSGFAKTSDIMGQNTFENVKNTVDSISDVTSGRNILNARDKAVGLVKNMIPGGAIIKDAKARLEKHNEKKEEKQAVRLGNSQYKQMIANGASEAEARKAQKAITDSYRSLNANQQTVKKHTAESRAAQQEKYKPRGEKKKK